MVSVRPMVESDIPEVISIWEDLGKFLGARSVETFLKVDSDGFYVAVENGIVVGSCAAVIQNDDLAAVGIYCVRPSHQGKGIGLRTWKKAMEHLGCRNCFLNSVEEQFETYRDKAGYKSIDKHSTVIWCSNSLPEYQLVEDVTGVKIESISEDIIEQVIAYDEQIIGYNRSKVISNTMDERDCLTLAALRDGVVCGYGSLRDEILGTKLLGPLYADSLDVAELILNRLLSMVPSSKECGLTIMGIDANPLCARLAKKMGLKKTETLSRMYTKAILDAKFEKVYSQFNVDFCTL